MAEPLSMAAIGGALLAPAVLPSVIEGVGGLVEKGVDWFQSGKEMQERKERLQTESEKTKELLQEESRLAREERAQQAGLESQKSGDILEKELKFLQGTQEKDIDAFNRYFDNIAKKRAELLSKGVPPQDITDFFNIVLSARGGAGPATARRMEGLYGPSPQPDYSLYQRQLRMGQIQNAFSPLVQSRPQPRQRGAGVAGSIRSFGTAYLLAQQQRDKTAQDPATARVDYIARLADKPQIIEQDLKDLTSMELKVLANQRGIKYGPTIKKKALKNKLKGVNVGETKKGYSGGRSEEQRKVMIDELAEKFRGVKVVAPPAQMIPNVGKQEIKLPQQGLRKSTHEQILGLGSPGSQQIYLGSKPRFG